MQAMRKIAAAVFTILFCSLPILGLADAKVLKGVDEKETIHFAEDYKPIPEKFSQNLEGEYWEELIDQNFPLTLIDWRLVTNPGSSDKYMDKRIIGTVKNNSEKEFSEVKIEFTVYDEEGAQIAIVFGNFYNFKRGAIWKFEIPVTSDVGKAELKGLYVPKKELKKD
jgi:hypothetical protein